MGSMFTRYKSPALREPRLHARRSRRCCCARTSTSASPRRDELDVPMPVAAAAPRSSCRPRSRRAASTEDFAVLLELQARRVRARARARGRRRSTTASAPRPRMTRRRAARAAAGARAHGRRLRAAGRLRPAARLPARPGQGVAGGQRVRRVPAVRLLQHPLHDADLDRRRARRQDDPLRAADPRRASPMLWDFGSAVKHHQLYSPWLPTGELPGRLPRLPRRDRADGRADGATRSREIKALLVEAGVADAPVGVDIVEPPFLFEMQRQGLHGRRRAAAHARRAGDQVAGRDHAAHPGRGDGRRRLPGHRRGAQARHPRERDRRAAPTSASTRWAPTRSRRSTRSPASGATRTRTTSPTG